MFLNSSFGLIETVQNLRFLIDACLSSVEVFRIIFRVDHSPTKSYNITHMITDRKHHPITEKTIHIARLSLSHQSRLRQICNSKSLTLQILTEKLPVAGSISHVPACDCLIIQMSTIMHIV